MIFAIPVDIVGFSECLAFLWPPLHPRRVGLDRDILRSTRLRQSPELSSGVWVDLSIIASSKRE